jgi:hypothetical protein
MVSLYDSATPKPFTVETLAREELARDRLFDRLTPEERAFYLRASLAIGSRTAARYAGREISALAVELGARIREADTSGTDMPDDKNFIPDAPEAECMAPYAEYDAETHYITVHSSGIERLAHRVRCSGPALSEAAALWIARNLLIAHELFHHLEATRLGPIHRALPTVAVPLAGGLWKVHRHVLRTREIAAHSFAATLLGMSERFL